MFESGEIIKLIDKNEIKCLSCQSNTYACSDSCYFIKLKFRPLVQFVKLTCKIQVNFDVSEI